MPKFNIEEAYKEALASATVNDPIYQTIQLYHPDLPEMEANLYIVNARTNKTFTLENLDLVEFQALAFSLKLPNAGENGIQELSLSVDNADRQASDFCKAAKAFASPIEVTYRPYLQSDLTTPMMNPPLVLFLSDVQISLTQVSAKATFADLLNRPFLSELYTKRRFGSLSR